MNKQLEMREVTRLERILLRAEAEGKLGNLPPHFMAYGDREDGIYAAGPYPDHVSLLDSDDWLENQIFGHEARRRRQLAESGGRATSAQVQARIDFYGGLCWICRVEPYETMDHVIPVNKGGTGWPANLRPACRPCNSRKSDHWPYP